MPTLRRLRPIVLFAWQSPPLLQLLRASTVWDLRLEPLGDHEGLAEAAVLEGAGAIPGLGADIPHVIVVCTPAQRDRAKEMVFGWGRRIPIVWAAHNGYEPELIDHWEGPLLTFSSNNLATFSLTPREHAYVIRPAVGKRELKTPGSLGPRPPLFTMQNRPDSRTSSPHVARAELLRAAVARTGVILDTFGQGQEKGFLHPTQRDLAFLRRPGYVSCLPNNAGFGLAEHEALGSGCPLVALAWGDAPVTLAGYPGLCFSQAAFERALAAADAGATKRWAEAGYDLLATHYSLAQMNAGILAFLEGLL